MLPTTRHTQQGQPDWQGICTYANRGLLLCVESMWWHRWIFDMLKSAPHQVCWASTHWSKTCGGVILPIRPRWPLLTARPWRNMTLVGQSRPRFTRLGQKGLIVVCTKIVSTRPSIKYVPTVLGRWTAALFRTAVGTVPISNWANHKSVSSKRTWKS